MRRKKYLALPDYSEPKYETDVDAQVARLREVLKLMSPECGAAAALGATNLDDAKPPAFQEPRRIASRA